jgi:hypothetical protein
MKRGQGKTCRLCVSLSSYSLSICTYILMFRTGAYVSSICLSLGLDVNTFWFHLAFLVQPIVTAWLCRDVVLFIWLERKRYCWFTKYCVCSWTAPGWWNPCYVGEQSSTRPISVFVRLVICCCHLSDGLVLFASNPDVSGGGRIYSCVSAYLLTNQH